MTSRDFLCLFAVPAVALAVVGYAASASSPNDYLIAHWELDSGDSLAVDSSFGNHTGLVIRAVSVPGKTNQALAFSGNGYVNISNAQSKGTTGAGLDIGSRDWTVAAWVKTTSSGMLVTKMGYMGGSNPDGWGISLSPNGTVGAHLRKSGAGEVNLFNADGTKVNDGQWHHVAVVFDRSASMIRYVDGAASGLTVSLASLSGQIILNDRDVRIGARHQAGDEIYFSGTIDDVRIYSRALSSTEIQVLAGGEQSQPVRAWSPPVTLGSAHGRLAIGNRVHVVGHTGNNLVHRSSTDGGANWSEPAAIAPAAGNYPMQYGGLYALGDSLFMITADGNMGPSSRHLDFRKSTNNGSTWSAPIRITASGQEIRRANIVASGQTVHVFGGQSGTGGYGTGIYYFRSTDGGSTWERGRLLYREADASARMAVDGNVLHVAFGAKLTPSSFGGRTFYLRSEDNGQTWSDPVFIGEISTESDVQARQQIVARDGKVFAIWQRERPSSGGSLPRDRLGYNRSEDGGKTWVGPKLLPGGPELDRNHQQVWLLSGGSLNVAWCQGEPSDPASPTGWIFSPDYGATWSEPAIAISTFGGNLPHGIVADSDWVHIIAEPGAGTYARRMAPKRPTLLMTSGSGPENILLRWEGNGLLEHAQRVTGPWAPLSNAVSPHPVQAEAAAEFFRVQIKVD